VIEHVTLWTRDLERSRMFYGHWFGATPDAVYESTRRAGSRSCVLSFGGGARLEIMEAPALADATYGERVGHAHLAIAVGSRERVHVLVRAMHEGDVVVRSPARDTGDGYYEAVVEDPDGNLVVLMASPTVTS
jgi:lactoylglutathione lyase